ncbi:transposase [Pelomicrobium methylotrophicum]|uniref:transposase n=1 Tax=Pelomicrobium methylotrophicum TaxID=2602750 RepID=UPI001969AC85|nr:transposase [Pelomicrobium methylotrophicum]
MALFCTWLTERKTESLLAYYEGLSDEQKANIEAVAMDLWPAYISATEAHIPQAREKIAFDKFHVAKSLGEAVDKVRKQEHCALLAVGEDCLKGSQYDWLTNPDNMTRSQRNRFCALRDSSLKTARAPGPSRNSPWVCGTTRAAPGRPKAGRAGCPGRCAAALRR